MWTAICWQGMQRQELPKVEKGQESDNMTNIIFAVLLSAVAMVESSNDPLKNNSKENAVGLLQIRQCCVDDLNRHYGTNYKLDDFYNPKLAKWAFVSYGRIYGAETAEEYCKIWNGGPRGMKKAATAKYWRKVKCELKNQEKHNDNTN